MKQQFAISVAGTQWLVQVQPAGPDAFEVQVAGQPPVLVHRRGQQHGSSQWFWQQGFGVVLADVDGGTSDDLRVMVSGTQVPVHLDDPRKALLASLGIEAPKAPQGPVVVRSPMPGRVVKVLVKPGERVALDQALLVVEAMKMENELRAPRDAQVAEVKVSEGAAVEAGADLMVLTPTPQP